MITAGIDLAASPERTAVATIEWADTRAVVRDFSYRTDDDAIMSVIEEADKTGIDCPFGWPDAFVQFVAAHHWRQADLPGSGISAGWQQELTMRRTDAFVHDKLGITPLSVSADKLARIAFRCAILLARLGTAGRPVDRSGVGPVVEVYPRASLQSWDLYRPSHRQAAKTQILDCLVTDLRAADELVQERGSAAPGARPWPRPVRFRVHDDASRE